MAQNVHKIIIYLSNDTCLPHLRVFLHLINRFSTTKYVEPSSPLLTRAPFYGPSMTAPNPITVTAVTVRQISGNLMFSPDISVSHRIILIHDNDIDVYTNSYVHVFDMI